MSELVNLATFDFDGRRWGSEVAILDVTSGEPLRLKTVETNWVSDVAWSPGGKWLSFLAGDGSKSELWVAAADGSEVFKLSELQPNLLVEGQRSQAVQGGRSVSYVWSEDESGIAFVARDWDAQISGSDWLAIDPPKSSSYNAPSSWTVFPQLTGKQESAKRRSIADKLFAGNLVFASIDSRKTRELAPGLKSITDILKVSPKFGITVKTQNTSDAGRAQSQLHRVGLMQPSSAVVSSKMLPSGMHGEIIDADNASILGVTLVSHESRDCIVSIVARGKSGHQEICFKSEVSQLVDFKNDLLLLLSDNTMKRISKRDFRLTGSLAISLDSNERLQLMSPISDDCENANSSIMTVRPKLSALAHDPATLEAQHAAFSELVQLDFDARLISRIDIDPDDIKHRKITGYTLCDGSALFARASARDPVNYDVYNAKTAEFQAITQFEDPRREFLEFERIDIDFDRVDGLPLSARIVLPKNTKNVIDGRYPAIVWQYPTLFPSAVDWTAGRRSIDTNSHLNALLGAGQYARPQTSSFIGTWLPYLLPYDGFAVIAYPHFPYLGEDGGEFGTYSEQRTANAQALVDALDRTNLIDIERMAIGGQSRGGTVTSMLLAETDLFRAGIATSGPSTFTNMPLGYQFEGRSFSENPDTFYRNSPILNVEKINEPLLMIHGELDEYPNYRDGAFLHHALTLLGQKSKILVYPDENHDLSNYWENQLHILSEVSVWLDAHVLFADQAD